MLNYTEKTYCRACMGSDLSLVLDLNDQPLANNYHSGEEQEYFPLKLNLCKSCFHLQLSVVVEPDLMFKDYLYVSGTSKTLHDYFADFVDICERYAAKGKRVLDIACNDGTQLDKFKDKGWETFGVDPAENLHHLSKQQHDVVCAYWDEDIARSMEGVFDVIVAQNVFAHVDDVQGFLKACSHVMDDDSHLLIQTSQANMVQNNEFDTIYHEHLSFFNSKSMKACANLSGFSLVDVFKTDIHGTSYVFVLKKGTHSENKASAQIAIEDGLGLFSEETYVQYAKRCYSIATDLKDAISDFRDLDYKIIGYGAAAKGNTFLNFGSIDLDYIVDDNDLKWDLLTPGRDILIKNPQSLQGENADAIVVVPLAWNFFREISSKTQTIVNSDDVKFIRYFPEIQVT